MIEYKINDKSEAYQSTHEIDIVSSFISTTDSDLIVKQQGNNNLFISLTQLLVPCMGIGTLALPYCASKSGILAEVMILTFSSIISCLSMHLLSWSSRRVGSFSYGEMVSATLGTKFRNIFDLFVILGTTLSSVNFQISFQLLVCQLLLQLNSKLDQQRIMLITQLIFTPVNLVFSLQRSLYKIKYISLLGFISIIYLIFVINFEFQKTAIDFKSVVLFQFSPDLLSSYPITFFCFVCHLFVLPVMKDLKAPTKRRQSQLWILSSTVCFISYLLIITAGYLNSLDGTQLWIIDNLSSWQAIIGNIGISISLFFSVPFMMIASKNALKDRFQWEGSTFIKITVIQQIGTGIIAILFPEIKQLTTLLEKLRKLLSLLGGFTGTTTVCVFPLLIYMKLFKFNYLIVILEFIAIFLGYMGAIYSQF